FLCYLRSPVFVRYVESVQMGIAYPAINDGQFFSGLIPLPPLAEQHRIVAKVDELMALCDRLEARQADADSAHAQLVQALLGSLTQASDAADFAQSWQRLAEHFHTLFTTESSIDALKQTLLQLAVMGKLVPQDPNDEPASELLKRIADAKEQAASQGRVRKVKTATDYRASDTEVTVPAGWSLSTVGEVTICRDGERIPVSQAEREGRAKTYDYYGASGVIDKIDGYLFDKPLLLVGEDGANLINRSTPIAFMARGKYWVNNHAHVLDGVSEALLLYVQLYFNAIDLKPYVTGTAQPKMNQAKMNSIVLLLPPEAEQHRIVAKVDQLMALCDQLKARLNQARQVHEHLASALVEQAVA
ncbi:restriction endonuclease subunit S, partial [Pseudomonas aeruginosa]